MISSLKARKGASCRAMFMMIAQTSMEQQQALLFLVTRRKNTKLIAF
jgi:hypothetical protein